MNGVISRAADDGHPCGALGSDELDVMVNAPAKARLSGAGGGPDDGDAANGNTRHAVLVSRVHSR